MNQFTTTIDRLRRQATAKRRKVVEYEARCLKAHATRTLRDAEALEAKAARLEAQN